MKKPNRDEMTQLVIPMTAGIGLALFAWELAGELRSDPQTTPLMWAAVALMAAGSVFAFVTACRRWSAARRTRAGAMADELTREQDSAPLPVQAGSADYTEAAERICRLITGNRELIRQFRRDRYDASFQSYLCQFHSLRPYMESLDDGQLQMLAESTLQLLEQDWKNRGRKAPAFDDQLLIAVYFVPAMTCGGDPGGAFCVHFRNAWKRRYPGSVFQLGTYEEVSAGFRKKTGMCFITTAVCEAEGKPDDCYELEMFRSFRDHWLMNQRGGRELVERYYSLAPGIVTLIDMQADARRIYRDIRQNYLAPCLRSLERGDYERCKDRYMVMVQSLADQFQLS